MRSPDKIWIEPAWAETFARPDGDPVKVAYIPEAIAQSAVAAALEAAADRADVIANGHRDNECSDMAAGAQQVADEIRALITPSQHDALAAHVAAEVAKARAEDASVNAENEACAKMLDNEADDYEADASRFRGGTDPHHFRMNLASTARKYAAAIRARKGDAL